MGKHVFGGGRGGGLEEKAAYPLPYLSVTASSILLLPMYAYIQVGVQGVMFVQYVHTYCTYPRHSQLMHGAGGQRQNALDACCSVPLACEVWNRDRGGSLQDDHPRFCCLKVRYKKNTPPLSHCPGLGS